MKKRNLPKYFKWLFWWCNFSEINLKEDKERIVVQTLNYGQEKHLKWIIKNIEEQEIKKIIWDLAQSEFNKKALETISKVFKINKFRWKTRGEKVHFLIHRDKRYQDILKIIDKKFKNRIS